MSQQKLNQAALKVIILVLFFTWNSLRAQDQNVLEINFQAFIPQYIKELQKNAKEDFEFSFGRAGEPNKTWWTLWGLLDSRRSPFEFPEINVTNFEHFILSNETLEKAYQNYQLEYRQSLARNQFTIPFVFSLLFSSELRAFMKFPWLRKEREDFAFRQLELEAMKRLKREPFFGRRQFAIEYFQKAVGVRLINFGRVLILPQRVASIRAGLKNWIENGSKIEWNGSLAQNNTTNTSAILSYAALKDSNDISLALEETLIPSDVDGLTKTVLYILSELDRSIESSDIAVSLEELMYALVRYSDYQTVFELTNPTLLKYFREFREVEWQPVSIKLRDQLNCHSPECLRETLFHSLNQEYLRQAYRKIFYLYGQIAENQFGNKAFPQYATQLAIEGFSQNKIKQEYEHRKELEYIKEVHLESQVIHTSAHSNLNTSQIIGYFEREVLPIAFNDMLEEVSKLYKKYQNMRDIEERIPALREKYLNQSLKKLLIKISDNPSNETTSQTFSFSNDFDPINIEESRSVYEDKISSTTTNILFEQFRRHYKDYLKNSKDFLPIDLVIQSVDLKAGRVSFDLVLLKDFSINLYKSFYESQLEIEQSLLKHSRQEANIRLARQVVSNSISVLDKNSPWVSKDCGLQRSQTTKLIQEILSSIEEDIEESSDLFYSVRHKKDSSFTRDMAVTQAIESKFIRQNAIRLSMPDKGLELLWIDLEPGRSSVNKLWSTSEFLSILRTSLQLKFESTKDENALPGIHCLLQEITSDSIDHLLMLASQIEHLRIVDMNQHRIEIKMRRSREQSSFDSFNFLQR